jgi:hypothetical protein
MVVLVLAVLPVRAQCGNDGLDGGPCCAVPNLTLPQFPGMSGDARFLCFDQCTPQLNQLYCVKLGVPIPAQLGGGLVCGSYTIRFTLFQCGTINTLWNGLVRAQYSRTWLEQTSAAGVQTQVWRFIISGDFAPTPTVPNTPCDRPGCFGAYQRIYFCGHIDYARDCSSGNWAVSWALSHECDGVHHPLGGARPAPAIGLHPTRSYTMVGPGTGFVVNPAATVQSDGPIIQQSMRWNNWATAPVICRFREPCQGNFVASNPICRCLPAALGQYVPSSVGAQSSCGSAVATNTANPTFMQKRIGGWTVATAFPGLEFLLFDFGDMQHVNGCTGAITNEWFEGSETIGGFPAFDFAGLALGRQFEDLESCNTSPTAPAPIIGGPHYPYYLLNFNMP